MNLPSIEECEALFDKYNVPQNIRDHSEQVRKICVFLAKKFNSNGIDVNAELLDRAARAHDIAKLTAGDTTELESRTSHGVLGKKILEEEGYPEVANLVAKHVFMMLLDNQLKTWEEKIIKYADLRVKHDEIVSMEERFRDLHERYGDSSGRRKEAEQNAFALEKEIFGVIGIKPEDLKEKVEEQD